MRTLERQVEIDAPPTEAYSLWARCPAAARILEHARTVSPMDERQLRVPGASRSAGIAAITELVPGRCIAWTTTSDPASFGRVRFDRVGDDSCRVTLELRVEPPDPVDRAADVLRRVDRGIAAELGSFKRFVEARHPRPD